MIIFQITLKVRYAKVQISFGTGYIDDGVGLRKAFANEIAVITYLQNLGWHFDDSWGPHYSFSKDVTGAAMRKVRSFDDYCEVFSVIFSQLHQAKAPMLPNSNSNSNQPESKLYILNQLFLEVVKYCG